jgi:hypothetical protein
MLMAADRSWCLYTPPKTASTTLSRWLPQTSLAAVYSGQQHDFKVPVDLPEDALLLFVVRNPYTRAESLWRHRLNECANQGLPLPTFEEYLCAVRDQQLTPFFLTAQATWADQLPRIDRLLRFESLWSDLTRALSSYDWTTVQMPHYNRNSRKVQVSELQNSECRRLIREWAVTDFYRFGYRLDWYPST